MPGAPGVEIRRAHWVPGTGVTDGWEGILSCTHMGIGNGTRVFYLSIKPISLSPHSLGCYLQALLPFFFVAVQLFLKSVC